MFSITFTLIELLVMKRILILFMLVSAGALISLESCTKSDYYDATVIADGDENVDGCGWLISIGGVIFYPVGLSEDSMVDGKMITIQYTVSAIPHTCINNQQYQVATITKYLN